MTTIEYDLDLSGGLMEEIQRLTAPPQSEESLRRQRAKEREFRRPRAVNHDCCDSCKEGGDLLCCDKCPAAFHLLCHDPPLEEEEVPTGEWLCHECRTRPVEEDDRASTCSSQSRQSVSSQMSKKTTASSNTNTVVSQQPRDALGEFMDLVGEEMGDTPLHPLQMLARAAKYLNPKQFDLPKDANCPIHLPGSSKRKPVTRGAPKKLAHELDNGMVPLPAKLCYICNKSCRVAPLIQCDYCPAFFHADCLSPPLSSLPAGRWMCPNHPESFLEEKLLQSVKLTERVKLWNKFTGPVDQQSVKVKFFNKVHRRHPPFRIKVRHQRKHTINVPSAIKSQYAHPPPCVPRAPLVPAEATLGLSSNRAAQRLTTPEEQEEWLSGVVSLQTGIARHLAQRQLSLQKTGSDEACASSTITSNIGKPTASVTPVVKQEQPGSPSQSSDITMKSASNKSSLLNGVLTGSPSDDNECVSLPNGPLCLSGYKANGPVSLLNHIPGEECEIGKTNDLCKGRIEEPMEEETSSASSSHNLVKLTVPSNGGASSTQTKSFIINTGNKPITSGTTVNKMGSSTPCNTKATHTSASSSTSILSSMPGVKAGKVTVMSASGSTSGSKVITVTTSAAGKSSPGPASQVKSVTPANLSSSPAIIQLSSNLQSYIEGTGELELNKLDEKLVHILALQRLQQLVPQKQPTSTPAKKSVVNGLYSSASGSTEVRARALLCPLTGKGQPVPMPYRNLTVGTGADMDVCLSHFGHCNFVSAKQACIFYDETSRQYELLNYSEHGTTVDNVLYSCDFSEKASTALPPNSVVSSVRKIIGKGKAKKEKEVKPDPDRVLDDKDLMSAHAYESYKACSCKASSSSLIGGSGAGWEGTALLHHGSYIKLGCLQFVFSIVELAPRDLCQEKKQGTSLLKQQLKSPTLATVP